jgi:chemotaxis protein MotB
LPPGRGGLSGSQIWLTTFTDLTALMLTFFVLQFSMSKINEVEWQNLSDSFQQRLSSVEETQVPLPQQVLGIEPRAALPGDDLVYLTAVIDEHLERAGVAESFTVTNLGERILIRSRASTGDGAGEGVGAPQDALPEVRGFDALAVLIARLENRVDLELRLSAAGQGRSVRSRYRLALEKALAVQGRLAALGVGNLAAVKASLAPSTALDGGAPASSAVRDQVRIEFVIHAHEGGRG